MSFYVGQRVVCLNTLVDCGEVACIEGRVYAVRAVTQNCNCGMVKLDIGAKVSCAGTQCSHCGGRASGSTWWINSRRFRPLLDASLEEQVNELEEQPVEA